MRQGRMQRLAAVVLTGALLAAPHGNGHAAVRGSVATARVAGATPSAKQTEAPSRAKRTASMLQFTGYVSAIDKTSITVEKRGKNPEARVFTKHDEMRTTGDVERDARVTVYYREEGGKAIAYRVVVKPARSGSKSRS